MKKILLLLMAATLTLGFTACSDDDDDYPTLAQRNADKIRRLGITKARVYFPDYFLFPPTAEFYGVSVEDNFLVLTESNDSKLHIPLENISTIEEENGSFAIYIH